MHRRAKRGPSTEVLNNQNLNPNFCPNLKTCATLINDTLVCCPCNSFFASTPSTLSTLPWDVTTTSTPRAPARNTHDFGLKVNRDPSTRGHFFFLYGLFSKLWIPFGYRLTYDTLGSSRRLGLRDSGSTYELQSICPTQFNGHGFLIRDYIGDYTINHKRTLMSTVKGPLVRLILTVTHMT